jgi:hypothetical protein
MEAITPQGPVQMTGKQQLLRIWTDVTENKTLSPLLKAIGQAISDAPDDDATFFAAHFLGRFAQRIAKCSNKHCDIAALHYHNDYVGEWHVRNSDLEVIARVGMWVNRLMADGWSWMQGIEGGIKMKCLQQAYDRYQITGLRREHLLLLQNMLWDMDKVMIRLSLNDDAKAIAILKEYGIEL